MPRKRDIVKPDDETKKLLTMSAAEQVEYVKKSLGWQTFDKPGVRYLDCGKYLNRVFGSPEYGLRYGKTITLAGPYSSGKTLLAQYILGIAQQDGADIFYVDIENSADKEWARLAANLRFGKRSGNGYEKIAYFAPEIGIFGKTKKDKKNRKDSRLRLQTAEELFSTIEGWMMLRRQINPQGWMCGMIDSTTAILPEEEMDAGYVDANMRSNLSLPVFLNRLTKRFNIVGLNCNALIIYVSQIRINPQQMFGNPERIPGGNGVLFYPSIVAKVARIKGGLIRSGNTNDGEPIGLQSIITNMKNKVGGGSIEGLKSGFQIDLREGKWKFMSAAKLKKIAKSSSGGGENVRS